jgi:hypothetical protein
MNEKICSKCGKANSAEMSFCLNCGNSLATSVAPGTNPLDSAPTVFIPNKSTEPVFQPLVPNRPAKKSGTGFWLAVVGGTALIGLLLVAGVLGLVIYNWDKIIGEITPTPTPYFSPSPTRTPTPTPSPSPTRTPTPSPSPTATPTPTPPPPGAPRVAFERMWVDYNVTENGKAGMRIHAKFTTYNMKGVDGHLAIYFSRKGGEKLKSNNKTYSSTNGQVAVFRPIKPAYEPAVYDDLSVFFPNEAFNLGRGRHELQMDADIIYKNGTLIQHLTFYDFIYTY